MEKPPPQDFQSTLAPLLRAYLDYLEGLGYVIATPAHNLRRLDRFWRRHGIDDLNQLPDDWFLQLQAEAPELSHNTWRRVRETFRGLCRFLVRRGPVRPGLLSAWPRPVPQPYHPYVFSPAELGLIFDYLKDRVRRAGDPGRLYRGFCDYALYHLLYGCGLRVSEAVRLQVDDYDVRGVTLWVRPAKFGKDRLLPVGRRVQSNLNNLLTLRRTWFPGFEPGPLFLLCPRPRPYSRKWVSDYFRRCLRALGIYRQRRQERGMRYAAPHLHELRRSFAVHRLLAWYRQDADLDAKLPLLATYMGHAHFGHTKTYLPLTEELLQEAAGRFARRFDRLDWVNHDPPLR